MNLRNHAKRQLIDALTKAASTPGVTSPEGAARLEAALKQALLEFGSETPDNVASLEQITLVRSRNTEHHPYTWGLQTGRWRLSEITNAAESVEMPAGMQEWVPGLTQQQWEAALRIATLTLSVLEGEVDE